MNDVTTRAGRHWLAARAAVFVVLVPGVVAGYVPYRLLRTAGRLRVPELTVWSAAGFVLSVVGGAVLLKCVWDFFAVGSGTLAPVDPPRRLVASGLYRHTRNPMYNGVLSLLLGDALMFGSAGLAVYAVFVFAFFHLFVVLYEEPALANRFGESYEAYSSSVPRWGFTLHPYRQRPGAGA